MAITVRTAVALAVPMRAEASAEAVLPIAAEALAVAVPTAEAALVEVVEVVEDPTAAEDPAEVLVEAAEAAATVSQEQSRR
jgi:hypothetical protein